MGLIKRVDHLNVQVPPEQEDAAKHFYGEVLGLKRLKKPDSLGPAGQHFCISENPYYELHLGVARNANGQSNKAMRNHLGFQVDDLAAARKSVRGRGRRGRGSRARLFRGTRLLPGALLRARSRRQPPRDHGSAPRLFGQAEG